MPWIRYFIYQMTKTTAFHVLGSWLLDGWVSQSHQIRHTVTSEDRATEHVRQEW